MVIQDDISLDKHVNKSTRLTSRMLINMKVVFSYMDEEIHSDLSVWYNQGKNMQHGVVTTLENCINK